MYKLSYIDSNHDEITFYDDSYLDDEFVVIDPKLDLDVSSAGSGPCSFSVPPSNIAYNNLETFNTEIRCYKKDKMIWSGRITDIDIDFYNNQKIYINPPYSQIKLWVDYALKLLGGGVKLLCSYLRGLRLNIFISSWNTTLKFYFLRGDSILMKAKTQRHFLLA